MRFNGKTAIVTGAASGIGKAAALLLCRLGLTRIVVLDRAISRATSLVAELGALGAEVVACDADIADRELLKGVLSPVCATLGQIDILVNSAGVADDNEPEQVEIWQRVLNTNLNGTYFVTASVLPFIPDGGRIVNVSSILGKAGRVRNTAYSASKHAVLGLTKSLALDLAARKITVNAVLPGLVDTPMLRQHLEQQASLMGVNVEHVLRNARKSIPLRRLIEPLDVAQLITFLASEAAAAITAQSITIDGGYTCGA